MARRLANGKQIPVATIRYKDMRTIIPTEELRGFVGGKAMEEIWAWPQVYQSASKLTV
ncbi:MAG: hypothetical protein IPN19_04715 [Elusimicrobia bacterium]|nr:hypothetical protein [Elusimicrobiota bacterium]